MFLGCSVEGLMVAREIQEQFKHDKVCVRPWTADVFGAGGVPVDDLLKQVQEADFALFVFTPDDKLLCRDKDIEAPRDNVIFELGLFMDRLGRSRAFLIREHKLDLKIPSDLLGITPLTYVSAPNRTLTEQLGPPCNELRKLIRGLGAL
jgi:predicted nucleotide-binding protein